MKLAGIDVLLLALWVVVIGSIVVGLGTLALVNRRNKKSSKLPARSDERLQDDEATSKVLLTLSRKHNAASFLELSALCSLNDRELREALDRLEQAGLVRIENKGKSMDELILLTENGKRR